MEKRLVRVAETVLELENQQLCCSSDKLAPMAGLLKLDENENTVGPSPEVLEASCDYLRSRPINWHRAGSGELKLTEKLSEHLVLPKEAISCFNGSLAAVESVLRTYLEKDVEALIDAPYEKRIVTLAKSTGARVTAIEHADPFKPRIETVISNINPKTRAIFLANPNPYTGTAYSESEIVFLLAYAERVMVIVHEEFVQFCGFSIAELVMRFSNLAVIRSFSGAFGLATIDSAYLLTDPENMPFIERLKISNPISGIACAASCAALDDPTHVRQYSESVAQSKRYLISNLSQIGYEFQTTPANFILLKVSDSAEAVNLLFRENILVRDLSDLNGLTDYIRVTLGTPGQMERLLVVLGRLAATLATGYNRNRGQDTAARQTLKTQEMAEAR